MATHRIDVAAILLEADDLGTDGLPDRQDSETAPHPELG
jgi:hypothetical protein